MIHLVHCISGLWATANLKILAGALEYTFVHSPSGIDTYGAEETRVLAVDKKLSVISEL